MDFPQTMNICYKLTSITLAHGQKLMDPCTLIDQEVGTKLIGEANKEVVLSCIIVMLVLKSSTSTKQP